ncbi:hypothetical protein H0E87_008385 [Populus deltoides]|uniref:Calmodulin-binding protein n=1 Tax=Populus deltoides TaxID=3696 RepID=A0A8T2Z0N5_POPDE|nr:hypothetical protein H0E87_008385 [Populus deltoides]
MEMEVVMPVPPVDFNFDSTCSSPYMTAPSSPQRFENFFLSAPTSPTRTSSFCRELNDITRSTNSSSSMIPFDWEEKPGTPKSKNQREDNSRNDSDHDAFHEDFEFDFSGHLERASLSAEELFDGGKIKPLKPPPGYDSSVSSPRSPISRTTKGFDPFQAAIEETRKREVKLQPNQQGQAPNQRGRGRRNGGSSFSAGSIRKGSRSLSPLRVSDIMFDQEENSQNSNSIASTKITPKSSYTSSILSAITFTSKRYKKWKLKDLLLFRSASEGSRTTSCSDELTRFSVMSKKEGTEDVKNSSFRSTDSVGSARRRSGPISAHEVHYTVNRAVSEEMRRKTFLPYKQGLLGCLGFNAAHEIARGVGSLTRG